MTFQAGSVTASGHWEGSHSHCTFDFDGRTFAYIQTGNGLNDHEEGTYPWSIAELNPDGSMGNTIDHGSWHYGYFSCCAVRVGGRTFIYAQQHSSTPNGPMASKWFIQEVLPGGIMGNETASGEWGGPGYLYVCSFVVGGRAFIYGGNLGDWWIHEVLPGGIMGAQTDTGPHTYKSVTSVCSFGMDGKTYIYFQSSEYPNFIPVPKWDYVWAIWQVSADGKLVDGGADSGRWHNEYLAVAAVEDRGEVAIYSMGSASSIGDPDHWFLQEIDPGGKMGNEIANGNWNLPDHKEPYPYISSYRAGGRTFVLVTGIYRLPTTAGTDWYIQEVESGVTIDHPTSGQRVAPDVTFTGTASQGALSVVAHDEHQQQINVVGVRDGRWSLQRAGDLWHPGDHTVKVEAWYDQSGTRKSTPASVDFTVEEHDLVTIDHPTSNQHVDPDVTFTGTASVGALWVVAYDEHQNRIVPTGIVNDGKWSIRREVGGDWAPGNHTVTAEAWYDSVGFKKSPPASVDFTVTPSGPPARAPKIEQPTPNATIHHKRVVVSGTAEDDTTSVLAWDQTGEQIANTPVNGNSWKFTCEYDPDTWSTVTVKGVNSAGQGSPSSVRFRVVGSG